jgi:hypothetical protein
VTSIDESSQGEGQVPVIRAGREKLHHSAIKLQKVYSKLLLLQEQLDSLSDEEISVKPVSPRLPRYLKPYNPQPRGGDSDTSDPWTVPDGTADWDVSDGVQPPR